MYRCINIFSFLFLSCSLLCASFPQISPSPCILEETPPKRSLTHLLKTLVAEDTELTQSIDSRLPTLYQNITEYIAAADNTFPQIIVPLFRFTGGNYSRLVGIVYEQDGNTRHKRLEGRRKKKKLVTGPFRSENCTYMSNDEANPYYRFQSQTERKSHSQTHRQRDRIKKPRSLRRQKRGFNHSIKLR